MAAKYGALFDAVSLACLKLADYPEKERVAKVLVILSDGEDNSSHRSLKQAIEDNHVILIHWRDIKKLIQ